MLGGIERLWCWEGLGAGGEGDDRGWDGWMASLTRWMWVWVNSWSLWWTGRPGVLRFMRSQRVGHDWGTELTEWPTEYTYHISLRFNLSIVSSGTMKLGVHMAVWMMVFSGHWPGEGTSDLRVSCLKGHSLSHPSPSFFLFIFFPQFCVSILAKF